MKYIFVYFLVRKLWANPLFPQTKPPLSLRKLFLTFNKSLTFSIITLYFQRNLLIITVIKS